VLPQCLNTWITQSGCKDNSDYTCFCKNSDFTKNVIDCVSAYGGDTTTISGALSYLQGICAAFIPQNPGLITNCPSDIPITPPAAVSTPPANPAQPADTTTYTTEVVTETVSTCTPGQTVTDQGVPTVLSMSKISTIKFTRTTTLTTCGKCGQAPAQVTAPPQWTVVSIANTYTVPCTYTDGVSQGFPIPYSSTITQLTTAVTVPRVAFVTSAPVIAGATTFSVGLAQGDAPAFGGNGGAAPSTQAGAVGGSGPGGYAGGSTTFQPTAYNPSSTNPFAPAQQTVNAAPRAMAGTVLGFMAGGAMAVLAF
jgi:hypothetical protein